MRLAVTNEPLFELGQLVATPQALRALWEVQQSAWTVLSRHITGDWGDLCREDQMANNDAIRDGLRILSAYQLPTTGTRIWVITEADRSYTTILLPEEY